MRVLTPEGVIALLVLTGALLAVIRLGLSLLRRARPEARAEALTERLLATQSELAGRVAQLSRGIDDRLDRLSRQMGDSLQYSTETTHATLGEMRERLATIDAAQRTLAELSGRMASLHDLLSNKQARGALGQVQMEDLVRDLLPPGTYRFQAPLSTGRIADCALLLPNPPGVICLDAKYPLEAYRALLNAETDGARAGARRGFAKDLLRHVHDIAERYIVPGETADQALMFLPAESVYAEVYAHHPAVVEEAFRRRVWIVSPTTLMATLTTVRAIVKDARLSETAERLRGEIQGLVGEARRLAERSERLGRHVEQTAGDVRALKATAEALVRRGEAIDRLQMGEEEAPGS
ncbi:DNA recombination protein RmuC [Pararhodospirillum photometricum]|nr:DNA recombination protein RmuC [Pararhodospirillum photometricum]